VIDRNIKYEDSDHHKYPGSEHIPKYHDDFFLENLEGEATEEVVESSS
jgi:hypothetical protein